MKKKETIKLLLLIKAVNIKTLVSGDKQARIVLETLYPEEVEKVAQLSREMEVKVEFRRA